MPSKSTKQRNYIFFLRGKYKSKENTPESQKWIWDQGWLKIKEDNMSVKKIVKESDQDDIIKIYSCFDFNNKGIAISLNKEFNNLNDAIKYCLNNNLNWPAIYAISTRHGYAINPGHDFRQPIWWKRLKYESKQIVKEDYTKFHSVENEIILLAKQNNNNFKKFYSIIQNKYNFDPDEFYDERYFYEFWLGVTTGSFESVKSVRKQVKEEVFHIGDRVVTTDPYEGTIVDFIGRNGFSTMYKIELDSGELIERSTDDMQLLLESVQSPKKLHLEFSEIDRLWYRLPVSLKAYIKQKYDLAKLNYQQLDQIVDTVGPKYGYSESKQVKKEDTFFITDNIRNSIIDFLKSSLEETIGSFDGVAEVIGIPYDKFLMELYRIAKCVFTGGESIEKGITKEMVDQTEFSVGVNIEKEHVDTKNPYARFFQEKIALDHLAEFVNKEDNKYYKHLTDQENDMNKSKDKVVKEENKKFEIRVVEGRSYAYDLYVADKFVKRLFYDNPVTPEKVEQDVIKDMSVEKVV